MRIEKIILFFLTGLFFLSSCISQKKILYFQDSEHLDKQDSIVHQSTEYRLQSADLLYINISSMDVRISGLFNIDEMKVSGSQQLGESYFYYKAYIIDDSGMVDIPVAGKIEVKGLTVEQAKDLIAEKLAEYISKFNLVLRLANFRFSVLGEVKSPGTFINYNARLTIFEAIGMAGDIPEYGNRKKVMIARDRDGASTFHYVDLTDKAIMHSPFYRIHPNDIIYVEPLKSKAFGLRQIPWTSVFTFITTFILVYNFIQQQNK
jgi:polysaccharide biosynthesis/export protein